MHEGVPVRIAWSTRNWLLSISIILMSAGILHPTIDFTKYNKSEKLVMFINVLKKRKAYLRHFYPNEARQV